MHLAEILNYALLSNNSCNSLLNENTLKNFVQGPGEQKIFLVIGSYNRIKFNVLSRAVIT